MVYKEFQDLKLSALGMGAMRLPVVGEDDARIDEEKAAAMVDYAMNCGINYYDTAWGYHNGNSELVMGRFLDAYGESMEFCQIQLNWLDHTFQNAKGKLELLKERQIPVWVMEPLRGGKLAALPKEQEEALRALRPEETIPAWAFRFLQSIPEVVVTLSGMSNYKQLQENVATFETEKPLNQQEMEGLLELYNEHSFTGGGFIAPMDLMAVPKEKHPNACIGCRSCEAVCPQQIKISEAMSDFAGKLGA